MNRPLVSPSQDAAHGHTEDDGDDVWPVEASAADVLQPMAIEEIESRHATVDVAGHGLRLDKWLVQMAPEFSRSHLQGLIDAGHVRCGELTLRLPAKKLAAGQRITVDLMPTAQSTAFRAEAMALDIVFEDEHLMIINKPAGLVVHPAAGHWSGTLLNGLLAHHAGAMQLPRAGIVHRLDKDTSGLMVVAKTLQAQTALVRAIAAREVRREYIALVRGEVPPTLESIDAPIGRDPSVRVRMAVVSSGKPSRTDVQRLAVWRAAPGVASGQAIASAITAVLCRLHSGRTHQIRVHLSSRGHPLVGDLLYGGQPQLGVQRQALHAVRLGLHHPLDGQWLEWRAPLPADLVDAWVQVTGREKIELAPTGYN